MCTFCCNSDRPAAIWNCWLTNTRRSLATRSRRTFVALTASRRFWAVSLWSCLRDRQLCKAGHYKCAFGASSAVCYLTADEYSTLSWAKSTRPKNWIFLHARLYFLSHWRHVWYCIQCPPKVNTEKNNIYVAISFVQERNSLFNVTERLNSFDSFAFSHN